MRSFLPLAPLALLAFASPAAAQSGTLDQQSAFGNAWFNGGVNFLVWQSEVKVGVGGVLEGVELEIQGTAGATLDVSIRVGAGWNVGPAAFSTTVTAAGTGTWERVFVNTTSASIALNAGDLFVIEMVGNTGMGIHGDYQAPPATPPYPEELYLNGPGCFADCGWRIGFVTWMQQGGGPQLTKSGTCPGIISLQVTGATPGGSVAMLSGPAGTFTYGGSPCTGVTLALNPPTFHGFLTANGAGTAGISFNAPAGVCGRTVQGVDVGSCLVTNTITL